jgi:outer membrane immunogenic protein
MRTSVFGFVLTVAALLSASFSAWGQARSSGSPSGLDVAFTYNPMLANVTTSNQFWLQGGSAQVHDQLWRGFGIAGNVIGLHTANMNNSGVGLDLIAYTAGLRYTWAPASGRLGIFGEALGGDAHGSNSIFPNGSKINTSGNSLAMQIGGGINVPVSRHLMVRAIEADWLRTQLPNATTGIQNNLRLGAGILYRFR